ncbi:TraB/TrbI/VirB10 family type IV secretion system protein [Rickettsia endosymbiont of Cardiosporidium cionae]|uniref:TrbI/VirB10 family protein n=1 Tax=Rickettsia endosymbiont of Cardiosporidium cionae TaxID=2777155 RepID=UPI00189548D1|nr:TrbI/VirB10 family protein [Rickettsia endosymbiont of Cardiosporidium cionae]KAF8818570.1 TrbI/VirB10 family protein [Rickettsia endosymbiont of Cardiosporidium cionae]
MENKPNNNNDEIANTHNVAHIEEELSKVSSFNKKNFTLLVFISLFAVTYIYYFFIRDDDTEDGNEKFQLPKITVKANDGHRGYIPEIPQLPVLQDSNDMTLVNNSDFMNKTASDDQIQSEDNNTNNLESDIKVANFEPSKDIQALQEKQDIVDDSLNEKKIDNPPVVWKSTNTPPNFFPATENLDAEKITRRREQKRTSPITLISGALPQKSLQEQEVSNNFQKRGNLNLVMAKGKLIEAVVESAINTDFGGEIKAVISRDIYSEIGKNILIPKGSKLFGQYTTNVDELYGRVAVVWSRIDLTNGYSINFDGTNIDNLGLKGTQGNIDLKIKERLTNAVLLSTFDIGVASILDKIIKPIQNTNVSTKLQTNVANIRVITNNIVLDSNLNDNEKINKICNDALGAFGTNNVSSSAYSTISSKCSTLRNDTTANSSGKLTSLISTVNTSLDSLLKVNNTNTTETQVQKSSKKAFKELTNTARELIFNEPTWKTTVSIHQGTMIKVYVNKDYLFPSDIIIQSKLMP